jgi:hypothetical protein
MAEGLTASEVGREIADHHREHRHADHDRLIAILEAVVLSVVALVAAWSGYSAARWSTHSSVTIADALTARANAGAAETKAIQIRTLDSVSFNAVATAYAAGHEKLFALALRRLRPGYQSAMHAWLALHPLTNPNAPADPSHMPEYRIPQEAQARALSARADRLLHEGQSAAHRADEFVELTVLLAAVLFLVGIGSRFPVRAARLGLLVVGGVLLVVSLGLLLALPGPPHS